MKYSLQQLTELLQKQHTMKHDFVSGARQLAYDNNMLIVNDGGGLPALPTGVLPSKASNAYRPTEHFENQIAEKLGIPRPYFERMKSEQPALLDYNVNAWLHSDDRRFLIRSFVDESGEAENIVRAFLSNSYKTIDHMDVLFTALKAIKESGAKVDIQECTLTEDRMFVKVIAPQIGFDEKQMKQSGIVPDFGTGHRMIDVKEGAWTCTGFMLGNSETGSGSFYITPIGHQFACTNTLILKNREIKRIHLGERLEEGIVRWSDETKTKAMELVLAQTKDAIGMFLSPDFLGQIAGKILAASKIEIKEPLKAVEQLSNKQMFTQAEQASILEGFVQAKDFTQMGLINAVTFYAHEQEDAARQIELEELGAEILEAIPA